ncbi:MAG: hypothetical protein JWO36_4159 [Myxococcales bacterium]|nr:hypothetical protein [Myxococcales bacterium]
MSKLDGLVLGSMFLIACGTDSAPQGPEVLPDLPLTAAPAAGKGWQIITPIVDNIAPSSDMEMCTWTDIIADKAVDLKSVTGFQNEPPGHHTVAYYTTVTQPPGTQRICKDSDMATFRFLAGAGGEGTPNAAPGNLVWPIPAGAQIVLNHHYLNSSDQTLRGQSAMNMYFAEPGGTYIPSGNLAFVDTAIDVAQGTATDDIHCQITDTLKLWYLIPHMHAWGKHINVDLTQAGVKTRAFSQDWDPSYTFHPPEDRHDPASPLTLNAGDSVDIHCEWNNDSGHTLPFGFEMCVAFGEFVDDKGLGNVACDRGSWGPF